MASVLQSFPPSLPYNLTIAASKPNSDASRPLSPCHIPLPQSPPPTSPPPTRIHSNASVKCPQPCQHQPVLPLCPIAKLPSSVSKRSPTPQLPPPRPPRPQTSLPNLRPIVILSPKLASALPWEDRPSNLQSTHSPKQLNAPSPSSSYSSNSHCNDKFSTPLPSPAFFAPRTWPNYSPTQVQTSPLRSTTSSKSTSPRHPSPTSPNTRYYNAKWPYQNITSSDSISITALPPLPLPPPKGPLPDPPVSAPKSPTPETDLIKTGLTTAAIKRKKRNRSRNPRPTRDTTSSHFIHEVRNAQKIQDTIKANAANAAIVARANAGPAQQHSPHLYRYPRVDSKHLQYPQHHWRHQDHPALHSDRKQRSVTQPPIPELEGDTPITIDLTYPPPKPTFCRRHRRKIAILSTVLLVLGVTAGILAGIIWKLKGRT